MAKICANPECGKEFELDPRYKKKRFCSTTCANSCVAHKTMLVEARKIWIRDNPDQYLAWRKKCSERMKKNNPSKLQENVEKISTTKRANGTLNVWHGIRGGNGQETPVPQKILALALGWELEVAIPTKKSRGSGYPSCYKIDIANHKLKIGIEVDGCSHYGDKRRERDQKKQQLLESQGWKILRFTNKEVMNDLSMVLSQIKKEYRGSWRCLT